MTSTLRRSAALVLIIIAQWVARLAESFGTVVKAITTIGEIAGAALQESAKPGPQLVTCLLVWLSRLIRIVRARALPGRHWRQTVDATTSWRRIFKTDGERSVRTCLHVSPS